MGSTMTPISLNDNIAARLDEVAALLAEQSAPSIRSGDAGANICGIDRRLTLNFSNRRRNF
jgi:hypothetical protein